MKGKEPDDWAALRKDVAGIQSQMAKRLHTSAGVPYGKVKVEDFDKFDRVLSPTYRLVVLRKMVGAPVYWKSPNEAGTPIFVFQVCLK